MGGAKTKDIRGKEGMNGLCLGLVSVCNFGVFLDYFFSLGGVEGLCLGILF